MVRRWLSIILIAGISLPATKCLILDNSPPSKSGVAATLPSLISLLGGKSYYAFLSDQPNDGSPRSFLVYRSGNLRLQTWNGGPANILKGVVANGVIFAIDGQTDDTIWISRDQGSSWESWVNPTPANSTYQRLVSCNGTVIAGYANMAHSSAANSSTNPKAYYSSDQGATFSDFYINWGGTSATTLRGLDCYGDRVYANVAGGGYLYRSTIADLSAWTAADLSDGYNGGSYRWLVASEPGLAIMVQKTGPSLDYSIDKGLTTHQAGDFMTFPTATDGGWGYGNGKYFLGVVNSSQAEKCRIYRTTQASDAPSAITPLTLNCSSAGDVRIPAMFADDSVVLMGFDYNSQASTGLYVSVDGGESFNSLDLSSVWTGSGFISSIASSSN
ncbi:MAG: hypothetical protein KDK33_16620 [Leptospiraceae bacterium]|nr:hypothetical protein [Leptospiraceae bacterium]